jgi:hypothetical protein
MAFPIVKRGLGRGQLEEGKGWIRGGENSNLVVSRRERTVEYAGKAFIPYRAQ